MGHYLTKPSDNGRNECSGKLKRIKKFSMEDDMSIIKRSIVWVLYGRIIDGAEPAVLAVYIMCNL